MNSSDSDTTTTNSIIALSIKLQTTLWSIPMTSKKIRLLKWLLISSYLVYLRVSGNRRESC